MYMLKICLSLFRKFYIGKNEEVLFEEKAVIGDKEYFVSPGNPTITSVVMAG